jgi:hypothetical protein
LKKVRKRIRRKRLRRPRKSSIAVIVTVVLIAVVGVGGYFLLKGEEEGEEGGEEERVGLPEYPGSENYSFLSELFGEFGELPAGVEITAYSVSGVGVQDILDWYKDQMTGWTLENEYAESYMGMTMDMLLYRKGTEGAVIAAISGITEDTFYVLATGPWAEFEEVPH